jgi:hypothetical protein
MATTSRTVSIAAAIDLGHAMESAALAMGPAPLCSECEAEPLSDSGAWG